MSGPLLVFSEVIEVSVSLREHMDEHGELAARTRDETRRVYVHDVGTDQYWVALDYPHTVMRSTHSEFLSVSNISIDLSAVLVAGESLVVWSGDEVQRVNLGGKTEAVLFEHDQISWLEVSPDGTKLAVVYGAATTRGRPAAVLVLDIATGEELLHTKSHFDPIFIGGRNRQRWHADGTALLIEKQDQRGLLRLSGEFDAISGDWILSPDLRYALRVGHYLGTHYGVSNSVWDSFEVLDVEDGTVLWSVQAEEGGGLFRYFNSSGDTWWQQQQSRVDTSGALDIVAFRELAPGADWGGNRGRGSPGDLKALNATTGEVMPLTTEVEELLRGRAWSDCGRTRFTSPPQCRIRYDGQVIWEGSSGWIQHVGVIEPAGNLEVRDATPFDATVEPDPPPPPPCEQLEGPLLLDEVHRAHPTQSRLAIAYDEGTGRSWTLHRRPRNEYCSPPQAADGGFVACSGSGVVYVAFDGNSKTLVPDARYPTLGVAPDGAKVAVEFDIHVLVLEIPSGDGILRVEGNDLRRSGGQVYLAPWATNGWSVDGAAFLTQVIVDGYMEIPGSIVTLDGRITELPLDVEPDGSNLSPDARFIVRGRTEGSEQYSDWNWRSFDIIDFATERILWSVQTAEPLRNVHWEWASPTEFAWSSGAWPDVFRFDLQRLDREAERAEVSVLDVTTGEIEVLDSADYLARFHPPSRATTDCPENPGLPCKILLDGEVIGEGRWPRIIGFIEVE